MITDNDLYDLSAVFINIRRYIKFEHNIEILNAVSKLLDINNLDCTENQLRKSLAKIQGLNEECWSFIKHDNVYVYRRYIKNPALKTTLLSCVKELTNVLNDRNYDKAYDLVDCIHCLPNIISECDLSITKSYWRINLRNYRRKWDKNFLKIEQKICMKNK